MENDKVLTDLTTDEEYEEQLDMFLDNVKLACLAARLENKQPNIIRHAHDNSKGHGEFVGEFAYKFIDKVTLSKFKLNISHP